MKVIVDRRISETAKKELERLGCGIIKTLPHPRLYDEVKSHADMQIHNAHKTLVCEPYVYEYYKNALPEYDVVCGDKEIGPKYPEDTSYNVCGMGDTAICRQTGAAEEILSRYGNVINIKQGYAKCSICTVGEKALITSDEGVAKTLSKYGYDILKIRSGHIRLGRMSGFIGGASGLIGHDILAFNGAAEKHPDYGNIRDFCRSQGVSVVSLSGEPLTDIGTIIALR